MFSMSNAMPWRELFTNKSQKRETSFREEYIEWMLESLF